MEYKGEGIEALISVLDGMQRSNLILVDKKIRETLRCLAYYEEFRSALAYCNQGFDYEAEKKKALLKAGERKLFRAPKTPRTLVALVSNMLIEFDEGRMDFVSFAGDYFPSDNKQDSFDVCFQCVIEPFKLALVKLVIEGDKEDVPYVERSVEFAANGLAEQAEYLLVGIVKQVDEAKITPEARADYMLMTEGLASALDTRDSLMIKAIWLGVKKALASDKLCSKEIEKIDELLRLYLVVK